MMQQLTGRSSSAWARGGRAAPRSARATPLRPSHRHCLVRVAALDVEAKSKAEPADTEEAELLDVQPSTKEVQQFLNTLVSETSIAELHLQVGTFELKVRRSTAVGSAAGPVAAAAAPAPIAVPETLVITKAPPLDSLKTLEESMDESLVPILSPKVGIFRRGKYAAGKRLGKGNVANKGDQVKMGQVLGYVEQLGTFVPVETPQAGEVVRFLVDEGSPVEYRQEVVELAPFFGGHIIGDSKYM